MNSLPTEVQFRILSQLRPYEIYSVYEAHDTNLPGALHPALWPRMHLSEVNFELVTEEFVAFMCKVAPYVKKLAMPINVEEITWGPVLAQFTNVEVLHLGQNRLFESQCLGQLTKLESLIMTGSHWDEGAEQAALVASFRLPELTFLEARYCNLSSTTLMAIAQQCPKLNWYEADGNRAIDPNELTAILDNENILNFVAPPAWRYAMADEWETAVMAAIRKGVRLGHDIMDMFPEMGRQLIQYVLQEQDPE